MALPFRSGGAWKFAAVTRLAAQGAQADLVDQVRLVRSVEVPLGSAVSCVVSSWKFRWAVPLGSVVSCVVPLRSVVSCVVPLRLNSVVSCVFPLSSVVSCVVL